MVNLLSLAIFSSLAFNLVVQCALGLAEFTGAQQKSLLAPLFQSAVLFISILILWVFFTLVVEPLSLGFMEYLLYFPLSFLLCLGLETGGTRLFKRLRIIMPEFKLFSVPSAYNGLMVIALMLTLRLALAPVEALVMALGFAVGVLFSTFILVNIGRRSSLEMVPPYLRGFPLIAISAGLLSLLFTALSILLYSIVG
jgi:electron transport complex protein RnfA